MNLIPSYWENPTADKKNIEAIATTVENIITEVKTITTEVKALTNEIEALTTKITELLATKAEFTGIVKIDNLPTSDPGVTGQLYNDTGTVKVSQ